MHWGVTNSTVGWVSEWSCVYDSVLTRLLGVFSIFAVAEWLVLDADGCGFTEDT